MQAMTKQRETESDESPERPDPSEEMIRRNLQSFIAETEYSETAIADMAGIPQANLHRYASGKSKIPAAALGELARVFGRPVGDFFLRIPPPAPSEKPITAKVWLKTAPDFDLTKEDVVDYESFLERMRTRREKKKPGR